jgi:hypothetical protein
MKNLQTLENYEGQFKHYTQFAQAILMNATVLLNDSSDSMISNISENEEEYNLLQTLKHLVKLEMRRDLIKQTNTFLHFSNLEEASK